MFEEGKNLKRYFKNKSVQNQSFKESYNKPFYWIVDHRIFPQYIKLL